MSYIPRYGNFTPPGDPALRKRSSGKRQYDPSEVHLLRVFPRYRWDHHHLRTEMMQGDNFTNYQKNPPRKKEIRGRKFFHYASQMAVGTFPGTPRELIAIVMRKLG